MTLKIGALLLLMGLAGARQAEGQAEATGQLPFTYNVAAGLTALHANAQPAHCGCFLMYGGYAQISALRTQGGLGLLADYGVTSSSDINAGNHNLTLSTFLLGVRYSGVWNRRYVPYGQVLAGLGHSSSNFAIDRSTTSLAEELGVGLDYKLSPRFDLRVLEIDYLQTHVPNGVNDRQNLTRLTTGITYHVR